MLSIESRARWSVALLLAIALLLLAGAVAVMGSLATRPYLGWSGVASPTGRVTVTAVERGSSADRAGLSIGDELIRVGAIAPDPGLGRRAAQVFELDLINHYRAGDSVVIQSLSRGTVQGRGLPLSGVPGDLLATHILLFFAFWAIGGVLLRAQPRDPMVRLLVATILALTAGNFFRPATDLALNTTRGMLLQQICAIGRFLGPAMLVNFGLMFPRPTLPARTIAWVRGLAFGIPGVLFVIEESLLWRGALSPRAPYLIYDGVLATIRYWDIRFWVFIASWAACGALLLRATRHLAPGRERIQVKWIMWSVLFAVIADTVIVGFALYGAGRYSDFLLSPYRNLLYLTIAASLLIAIMRYDLFDVDRVIRNSVLYSGTTAFMFLLFTGCENIVSDVLATRLPAGSTRLGTLTAAILAAALFTPVRKLLDRILSGVVRPSRLRT